MSLIGELKRRNVFRVGVAYVVGGWLLLQLTDVLSELLDLPDVVGRVVVLVVVIGLPVALFIAWAFEMTPEGVKLEKDVDRSQSIAPQTGKKLNSTIVLLLALTVTYLLYDKFSGQQSPDAIAEPVATTTVVSVETTSTSDLENTAKSIAVLPFTNRSPNSDDAYFTDGVHDDLLTQLAKIDAFSVISRTSVLEYRDTAKNLKQIGKELGVANIMEGAVQRSGNRVRINVQLIDAGTDEHLWAEVYDRELTTGNLFEIQTEIARSIASALQTTLSESEIASVSDVPTENVAAYELYLQGNRFTLGETAIGFDTAIALYEEALKLDPDFKLVWIGMAKAHISNYWNYGGKKIDRENSRKAIDKAKTIGADFPELHLAEGFYHYWGLLDYDTALFHLEKAIAQMPGNADAHMWKGWASRRAGLWEQAIDSMHNSIRLSPRVVINLIETAQTLGYLGRYDEALKLVQKAYELEPDSYWAKWYLAEMLILVEGDIDRAVTLMIGAQHTNEETFVYPFWKTQMLSQNFDSALQIAQSWSADWEITLHVFTLREQLLAETLRAMGRETEANENARKALQRLTLLKESYPGDFRFSIAEMQAFGILGDTDKVSELINIYMSSKPSDAVEDIKTKYRIARSYAYAGMLNECVALLESLLSGYSSITVPWLELDPAFNGIRNEPGFVALLERHR